MLNFPKIWGVKLTNIRLNRLIASTVMPTVVSDNHRLLGPRPFALHLQIYFIKSKVYIVKQGAITTSPIFP